MQGEQAEEVLGMIDRGGPTSTTLSDHDPFRAEAGLGSAGVLVGQDLCSGESFVYDPWVHYPQGLITAPNIMLARRLR